MKRLLLILLASFAIGGSASATTYGFDCIAGTPQACGVGEAQLSADVTDSGGGTVTLTFHNVGSGTSSLTGVYLDTNITFASISIAGGAGTDFRKKGSPKDLPGGGSVSFSDDYRFTAHKPKAANGVNVGETLSIVLTLKAGTTYADVVSALGNGSFRIGLLIADADPNCVGQNTGPQCVGDPGVASFVNNPRPVPEPVAALLGCVACIGLAVIGRRR